MKRSTVLLTIASVILLGSLIAFAQPSAAQEKELKQAGSNSAAADRQPDKSLSAASSGTDSNEPAPQIYFPEPLHDFGTVPRGSKVSHTFKVINNGNAPLKLIKAKGS